MARVTTPLLALFALMGAISLSACNGLGGAGYTDQTPVASTFPVEGWGGDDEN